MISKKIFCYLAVCMALSWLITMPLFSQNSDFARQGPSGIFVGLGKNIPNGIKISHYKIERSENGGTWKLLVVECKTPATFEEFLVKAENNNILFPGNAVPARDQLEKLWQKAGTAGVFGTEDAWGLTLAVRMAFCVIYYDKDISENIKYSYRVTSFDLSGAQLEQSISDAVSWPLVPVFDTITLVDYTRSAKLFSMKWRSAGKHPADDFRVYCFENEKPKMLTGNTIIYTKKDTTWYLYQDQSPEITGMKELICFLVPMDIYWSMGKSTPVTQIGSTDFNSVYFTQTKAVKEPGKLGITLSWKISNYDPLKYYEVYRSLVFGRNFERITTLGPADTTFTDPNVVPDKIYYYYLQACGSQDFQRTHSNIFFDYGMDPGIPVTPSIYQATGVKNGTEIRVLLNDVNMAGIRVFRSNGISDSLYALGDLVRNDSNSVVFRDTSNALNGYNYYSYAVRSESTSHKLSELSNIVSIRPLKPTFPETPSSFHAYPEDKKIKLFWDNGGTERRNIQGYKLSRREETGNLNDTKAYIDLPGSEGLLFANYYTDSTAEAGKTYSYNLQAVDIYQGISKYSANLAIAIPVDLPIPPTDLKAVNTPDGIVLEWGPAVFDNLDMYRIYRYQRGNIPEVIKLVGKNVITFTDSSALKDQLYFYYLTTVDKAGHESVPCREAGILR